MKNNQRGNVLLYILIAVGLMAAITFAVSRDGGGQQASRMDDMRADLLASELIQHVASAEQVIYHMTQWGADYSDLKFDLPGSADFNTDVANQVYHPQGGGLQVFNIEGDHFPKIVHPTSYGWVWKNTTNVEWTPTTQRDLIFTALNIDNKICEHINLKLHGSKSIPSVDMGFVFSDHFNSNDPSIGNFLNSECAECVGKKSMCLARGGGYHAFYTIIGSR